MSLKLAAKFIYKGSISIKLKRKDYELIYQGRVPSVDGSFMQEITWKVVVSWNADNRFPSKFRFRDNIYIYI